jgi:hypothetical protein
LYNTTPKVIAITLFFLSLGSVIQTKKIYSGFFTRCRKDKAAFFLAEQKVATFSFFPYNSNSDINTIGNKQKGKTQWQLPN